MKEYDKNAFVADLIKALEDAELASQTSNQIKGTLAQDAYEKLQFDFPVSQTISEPITTTKISIEFVEFIHTLPIF